MKANNRLKRILLLLGWLWLPIMVTSRMAAQGATPRAYLPVVQRAFPTYDIQLQLFASGIANPTAISHAGDDRLFVAEKSGRIRIVTANLMGTQIIGRRI